MSVVTSEHALLDETLNRLETALLTPAVSGELQSWIANVRQAAVTFAMDWTRYLHTIIHEQYHEIAKNDPEMSTAIEKMIATDRQLLDELAKFHESVRDLEARAANVQWNEGKLAAERQQLEDAGICLIVHIKKQRIAAETFLSESFYRDRGVKD
jgi:hypothetical protein